MEVPEWVWGVLIPLALTVAIIFVRRWSYNIAIRFVSDGAEYTRHRDGHFTDSEGRRVADRNQVARLIPLSEAAKKEWRRSNDPVI